MDLQQAQASHQSKLNIGYWGRFCAKEVLESAICLDILHKRPYIILSNSLYRRWPDIRNREHGKKYYQTSIVSKK
jgi:hypothetical protein